MTIEVTNHATYLNITVDGVIKSIADTQSFQDTINGCSGDLPIEIHITNSFSLTSSVIGYLLKKIQQDQLKISLIVYHERLWELLESLGLIEALNARKKG